MAADLQNVVWVVSIWYGSCVGFFLATSKVISEWVLTCDSAHSWRPYSAVSLGNQATSIMTWYPTQSHYPVTESTSFPILIMPSACLGSDKYNFLSHWFDLTNGLNVGGSDSLISQTGRQTLYLFRHSFSFSHPVWSQGMDLERQTTQDVTVRWLGARLKQ